MKLRFVLKDKKNVNLIDEYSGRIIGRIFTPSGTSRDKKDAIQICGFSRAFELWGCGVIGDDKGNPTQDIQLLFKEFDKDKVKGYMKNKSFGTKSLPVMNKDSCDRCYSWRDIRGNCKCSELKVFKRYEDIEKWEKRKKEYDEKVKVIDKL